MTDWGNAKPREEWDRRTRMIANLIPPGSVVLEFGAWTRLLERKLPEGCTYIPSDKYDRGPGTIVCDLNGDLPDFPQVDIIVFGGVLEYIKDVPRLISHLANRCKAFVVSYAFTDSWYYATRPQVFVQLFERHGFSQTYCKPYHDKVPARKIMRFERGQET